MKITNNDIDALIDVSVHLNILAGKTTEPVLKNMYTRQCHHVRKIYLMLLHASGRDPLDLRQLCFEGIAEDAAIVAGIKRLCPTALEPHEVDSPSATNVRG
jgi:hypothetical protein